MHPTRNRVINVLLIAACLSIVSFVAQATPRPTEAQSTRCSAPFLIGVNLANGSRWSMCYQPRVFEGVVFYDVYYTPPGGPARLIFFQMNLAELHVPYDQGSPRFFDLSVFGLGGGNLQDLAPADCPGGTLRRDTTGKDVLCQSISNQGYAFKHYLTQKQATALTLFSVSAIGQYNYVVQWKFYDDGTVEPAVGAGGRLQFTSASSPFGWPLGPGLTRLGNSHVHNYWWRLDIDLAGTPNDRAERIQFTGSGTAIRPMAITAIPAESRGTVSPENFRSWRIRDTAISNTDNHSISYELVPDSSHVFRGPNNSLVSPYEPWTANDLYVTTHRPCEQFLTHNPTIGGCGSDVTQFANNETVTDPVLWYGTSFHHLPRDEDEPNMSVHWTRFQLVPRDMTATNRR